MNQDLKSFLIFFVSFITLFHLIAGYIVYTEIQNRKKRKGIRNYDPYMRNFVYKTNLPKEEIYSILQTVRSSYEPTCTINEKESMIRFDHMGTYKEYALILEKHNGYNILKLNDITFTLLAQRTNIPSEMNIMVIEKLGAEPIPYNEVNN